MNKKEKKFVECVWEYYQNNGRSNLPWRKTKDSYKILVSEVMLQQTQVERVIPKYKNFSKKFPNVHTLANANLGDVLKEWQGLGYNRRAKMLHTCARKVMEMHKGKFPRSYNELVDLPGIGPYTAGAIMAFSLNIPVPIIETNIRTVYLYHFYNDQTDVADKELIGIIEKTLDQNNPREWYWALMDYGVYLKKEYGNQNSRSKHYAKQSKFDGSDRQIRGTILKILALNNIKLTRAKIHMKLSHFEDYRIDAQIEKLLQESMIQKVKGKYQLPS